MNAFEQAIECGEIDLGEYASPLLNVSECASFLLSDENDGEDYVRARSGARSKARGNRVAVSTLHRVCDIPEVACLMSAVGSDWMERLKLAELIVGVMARSFGAAQGGAA